MQLPGVPESDRMKVLLIESVVFLILILAAVLRGRKTRRSALYTTAQSVSWVLRWLAAFVAAVFTVIDELGFWERVGAQVRLELAQDSFEAAQIEEPQIRSVDDVRAALQREISQGHQGARRFL